VTFKNSHFCRQTGQVWGGRVWTTVLPQLLHFQVFSGRVGLLSVMACPPLFRFSKEMYHEKPFEGDPFYLKECS
jgi:hypothetical protein